MKVLYIHAGGSKTGSSAIQNYLELHHSALEEAGFSYENRIGLDSELDINSGNGFYLYEAIKVARNQHFIDSLITSYFGGQDKAICSSEFFAIFTAENWKRLRTTTEKLGIQLKVVFYVRNVFEYFSSNYDQGIKRHAQAKSFSEAVKEMEWQHFQTLLNLDAILPADSLSVLSYDKEKSRLIECFLACIGVATQFKVTKSEGARVVNRSLTRAERQVLRKVNAELGSAFQAWQLSDALISHFHDACSEPEECDENLSGFFTQRFSSQTEWINTRFFNSKPTVSIFGSGPKSLRTSDQERQHQELALATEVERFVFDWVLRALKTSEEETKRRVLSCLTLSAEQKLDLALPPDFDPIVYLALNPDIAQAEAEPQSHYLTYGQTEGRQYRYPKSGDEQDTLLNELTSLRYQVTVMKQILGQWRIYGNESAQREADRERLLDAPHSRTGDSRRHRFR